DGRVVFTVVERGAGHPCLLEDEELGGLGDARGEVEGAAMFAEPLDKTFRAGAVRGDVEVRLRGLEREVEADAQAAGLVGDGVEVEVKGARPEAGAFRAVAGAAHGDEVPGECRELGVRGPR